MEAAHVALGVTRTWLETENNADKVNVMVILCGISSPSVWIYFV